MRDYSGRDRTKLAVANNRKRKAKKDALGNLRFAYLEGAFWLEALSESKSGLILKDMAGRLAKR